MATAARMTSPIAEFEAMQNALLAQLRRDAAHARRRQRRAGASFVASWTLVWLAVVLVRSGVRDQRVWLVAINSVLLGIQGMTLVLTAITWREWGRMARDAELAADRIESQRERSVAMFAEVAEETDAAD